MQERELETQKARAKKDALTLCDAHEHIIKPFLSEVEAAMKENRPVQFNGYAKSISHRAPKCGFTERQLAQNAVSDLKESIEYKNDFSLWEKEQEGLRRIIEKYPQKELRIHLKEILADPRLLPGKIRDYLDGPLESALIRNKEIEGFRRNKQESVKRMTAACKYIRKMHGV